MYALLAAACAGGEPVGERSGTAGSNKRQAPLVVQWSDPGTSVKAEGWTVKRCPGEPPALCVSRGGSVAGTVTLKEVPSLGEEKSAGSADNIQAVLAGRILGDYKDLTAKREQACGGAYRVETVTPQPVRVAGSKGLKYSATGVQKGRAVERIIGYRVYRDRSESLIQATAVEPGSCLTPRRNEFRVSALRSFETVLDRLVAGSKLPPATRFSEQPGSRPVASGNQDYPSGIGER